MDIAELTIGHVIVGIFGFIFLLLFAMMFFEVVPAGNVGVMDFFGSVDEHELQAGFWWKNPLLNIEPMSIKTQEIQETAKVPSKEGLLVTLDTSILYRIEPEKADQIYKTVGLGYPDVVIRPQLRSIIREVTAKYEAKGLYTNARELITKDIYDGLKTFLADRGIILESVWLRDLELPTKVTEAIEAKLKAEQEAEQMSFVLQKERLEAERKTIEAEGIKSAQEIIARSLTPEYLHWYWIQQISNQPNVMYIATEAGLPLFRDVSQTSKTGE